MNLTRMREQRWVDKVTEHLLLYRYNLTWGDQDLINIYFHFHPGNNRYNLTWGDQDLINISMDSRSAYPNSNFAVSPDTNDSNFFIIWRTVIGQAN